MSNCNSNVNRIKKIILILIGTAPLLSSYRSIVPSIDIATFFLLILGISYILFQNRRFLNSSKNLLILLGYITFFTPLLFIFQSFFSSGVNSTLSLAVPRYLKFIIVFGLYIGFVDISKADVIFLTNVIRCIVYISCTIVIIQQTLWNFAGIIIENPFLPFAKSDLYNNYTSVSGMFYRPSGFFLEPSHLAQYCLPFLCVTLFSNDNRNILDVIATCICILLTGSGIGLLVMTALVLVWNLFYIKFSPKKILFLFLLILIIYNLYQTRFVQSILSRFLTDNISGGGNAIQARSGAGYTRWMELPFFYKIFGTGFGFVPSDIYLNGIEYLLNSFGLIGILLLFFILISNLKDDRFEIWQKMAMITYVMLLFGAQMFNATSFLFWMALSGSYSTYFQKEGKKNEVTT